MAPVIQVWSWRSWAHPNRWADIQTVTWKQLLPSTCAFEMLLFPSRCPPSTKSGVGVYEDRVVIPTTGQACLSLKPSPHSLNPVQLFGMHSWLKQAKWAQIAHETEPSWHLPDHSDGDGPSHNPSLQCPNRDDDLLQCLMLTFLARDMLLHRLKTTILVTVAAPYFCQKVLHNTFIYEAFWCIKVSFLLKA